VVFHHCGYRCKSESISACVIIKSAFNEIYPPIFLSVRLLVKFLNTNHINSFYGKFRVQENSFHLVLSRSVMKTLLRGAELALRKLQDHLLFSAVVSSSVHRKRQKNEIRSLRFDDNKRIRVLNTLSWRHRILEYSRRTQHVTTA